MQLVVQMYVEIIWTTAFEFEKRAVFESTGKN